MATVVDTIHEDGRDILVYDNGAKKDAKTGYWISPPPSVRITGDNARAMLARRRAIGLRSQLEGLAESIGVDPSEIDDDLLLQSGTALRALTRHMAETFRKSNNLRGMAETYDKLVAPLVGDRREKQDDTPAEPTNVYILLAQFIDARQVTDMPISASSKDDVIDGTAEDLKGETDE